MQVRNTQNQEELYIISKYRISGLIALVFLFILGVLIFTGLKGLNAFLGLIFSIIVVTQVLVPAIIIGNDPLLVTFLVGLVILVISIPLSHGFNRRSLISLISSLATILIAILLSIGSVELTKLTGSSSEEAFSLQFLGLDQNFNLRGLLLSGIVIGILGILDDVTTTQVVSIEQISQTNPNLSFKELLARGNEVGKEHIISMVNTLGLAYVGTSLPLLLVFTISNQAPLWVNLNNEIIAEEIVRTLVGSLALLLAVPLSNFLAARYLPRNNLPEDYIPLKTIRKNLWHKIKKPFPAKFRPKNIKTESVVTNETESKLNLVLPENLDVNTLLPKDWEKTEIELEKPEKKEKIRKIILKELKQNLKLEDSTDGKRVHL